MNRFLQKATSASMSVALLFTLTGGAVADLSGDLNSDAVSVFETDALGEAVPADETLITVTAGSETAEEQRGDTPDLTENGYPDEEETLKNEEENEEEETETTSDDCAPEVTAHASAASVDGALDAEEATNSENETEEDIEPFLLIGDTEIDFTEAASGNGWSYECDDEGGFVVLEGFNGSDQLIGTAGSDLTIKTTGVNRIGTLIVDGDLNLIGSGILLIDNIELAEGKDLNLLTNTTIYEDGTGSVAVFVKRVEITVNEDGTETENVIYELINGEVAGILDENCVIPDGVTLRIPNNSSLLLQSVTKITETTMIPTDEGYVYETTTTYSTDPEHDIDETGYGIAQPGQWTANRSDQTTAPQLIISETAGLIIEALARITFNNIIVSTTEPDYDSLLSTGTVTTVIDYMPSIRVLGQLVLEASIENALIEIGNTGSFDGEGILTDSVVCVSGNREDPLATINLENSLIKLEGEGADLEGLGISGDCAIIYTGDNEIVDLTIDSGGKLIIQSKDGILNADILSVSGSIEGSGGAEVLVQSGIVAIEETCDVSGVAFGEMMYADSLFVLILKTVFHNVLQLDENGNVICLGTIYDYRGVLEDHETPRVASEKEKTAPDADIPMETTNYTELKNSDGGVQTIYGSTVNHSPFPVDSGEEELSYQTLRTYYVETVLQQEQYSGSVVFLLEIETEGGQYDYVVLQSESDGSIPAGVVTRIRILKYQKSSEINFGGGTAKDAMTVSTGNGNLGQDAGSMTGGDGTSVYSGGGITNPIKRKQTHEIDAGGESGETGGQTGGETGGQTGGNNNAGNTTPAATGQNLKVWAEETADENVYNLIAENAAGERVSVLNGLFHVSMTYEIPDTWQGQNLYVVFRVADGSLKAFRATYDQNNGRLLFNTDQTGRFVVVAFKYAGKEFSPVFYDLLARRPEITALG